MIYKPHVSHVSVLLPLAAAPIVMIMLTVHVFLLQGRAPPETAIPQEPPSVSSPPPTAGLPARVAAKPSLNLLDFDGESSAPPLVQQEQPAPAGAHAYCPKPQISPQR